jgi:4-amino-4-deoxy-L-arabinose transferase-like glycosyltransferase
MKNPFRLLFIVSLYAVLNLPYLTTFPPVNNTGDESWRMNIAVELMESGRPVASMFVDTPVGEEVQLTTTWIYNSLLSMFFYLFGISIWSGRFLSFVCGLFVVLTTYRFGKAVGGSRTGLLAALLISTFHVFSWHSREMRQEVMLMAFVTFSDSVTCFMQIQKRV